MLGSPQFPPFSIEPLDVEEVIQGPVGGVGVVENNDDVADPDGFLYRMIDSHCRLLIKTCCPENSISIRRASYSVSFG